MKKLLIRIAFIIAFFPLTSFKAGEESKTITLTLSTDEWNTIYQALGEMPAKSSEQIRAKIVIAYQKAIDTTKHK